MPLNLPYMKLNRDLQVSFLLFLAYKMLDLMSLPLTLILCEKYIVILGV